MCEWGAQALYILAHLAVDKACSLQPDLPRRLEGALRAGPGPGSHPRLKDTQRLA